MASRTTWLAQCESGNGSVECEVFGVDRDAREWCLDRLQNGAIRAHVEQQVETWDDADGPDHAEAVTVPGSYEEIEV